MRNGRRSRPTGDTSPTCSAMAMPPACGFARRRRRATCRSSPPEPGVTLCSARRLRPTPRRSTSCVRPSGRRQTIWRVPFLGGTPRLLIQRRGQRHRVGARRSTHRVPALSRHAHSVDPADCGGRRMADRNAVLASSAADVANRVADCAVAPEHPSGLVTRRPAHRDYRRRRQGQAGRVLFVDSRTGSTREVTVPNGIDERARLARSPIARGQPARATRRAESVVPADVSSRLR